MYGGNADPTEKPSLVVDSGFIVNGGGYGRETGWPAGGNGGEGGLMINPCRTVDIDR